MKNARIPILGLAALSGTGKTTLLVQLLQLFAGQGYRVGVVKHAHHSFDTDKPGKDSYELRKAGARQMLVGSRQRWALVAETDGAAEPDLDDMLGRLDQGALDFILVEGFKTENFPKIELHRVGLGHPLLFPDDSNIVAVAADAPDKVKTSLPLLDLNRAETIAAFILEYLLSSDARGRTTRAHTDAR